MKKMKKFKNLSEKILMMMAMMVMQNFARKTKIRAKCDKFQNRIQHHFNGIAEVLLMIQCFRVRFDREQGGVRPVPQRTLT